METDRRARRTKRGDCTGHPHPHSASFPNGSPKEPIWWKTFPNEVVWGRGSFSFGLLSVSFGPSLVSVLVCLPRTAACTHLPNNCSSFFFSFFFYFRCSFPFLFMVSCYFSITCMFFFINDYYCNMCDDLLCEQTR